MGKYHSDGVEWWSVYLGWIHMHLRYQAILLPKIRFSILLLSELPKPLWYVSNIQEPFPYNPFVLTHLYVLTCFYLLKSVSRRLETKLKKSTLHIYQCYWMKIRYAILSWRINFWDINFSGAPLLQWYYTLFHTGKKDRTL